MKANTNTKFELYTGKRNAIADPTTDLSAANWLVRPGSTGTLIVLDPETWYKGLKDDDGNERGSTAAQTKAFRSVCRMFSHYVAGDFAGYTLDTHLVQHEFVANPKLGALKTGTTTELLTLGKNGKWYTKGQFGVKEAPFYQQCYHSAINALIAGDSVALYIPQYLDQKYLEKVMQGLASGERAMEFLKANIEAAQIRNETRRTVGELIKNGAETPESLGLPEQAAPKMTVKVKGGAPVDMFTMTAGRYQVCDRNGQPQYELEWEPTNELYLSAWATLSRSSQMIIVNQ